MAKWRQREMFDDDYQTKTPRFQCQYYYDKKYFTAKAATYIWAKEQDIRLQGRHAKKNQIDDAKRLLNNINRRRRDPAVPAAEAKALGGLKRRTQQRLEEVSHD